MKQKANTQHKGGSCLLTCPRSAEGNCLHSHHRGYLQFHSFVVTGGQPLTLLGSC
jgi:hypothetical protein